jgi:hypothetical protein
MLHTSPVSHNRLLVEFPEANGIQRQIVLKVLRCRDLDPFYEIAGTLVMSSA